MGTTSQRLGYTRVSTGHEAVDAQADAFAAAGVDADRVYSDKLTGTSTKEQRPGLAGLLGYARPEDAIVVVGVDRLGRSAAEVLATIKDLVDREVVIRSLREGVDSATPTGRGPSWAGTGDRQDSRRRPPDDAGASA